MPVGGEQRNADTAGNRDVVFLFPEQVLNHRQKPLRFLQSGPFRRNGFEENQKLISANPSDQVRGAGNPTDRRGKIRQNRVSKQMTHSIVDYFEVININHEKRALFAFRRSTQILFNQALNGRFVIQAGQRIPFCFLAERINDSLFCIHIDNYADRFY